jgi:hypothetical protein
MTLGITLDECTMLSKAQYAVHLGTIRTHSYQLQQLTQDHTCSSCALMLAPASTSACMSSILPDTAAPISAVNFCVFRTREVSRYSSRERRVTNNNGSLYM